MFSPPCLSCHRLPDTDPTHSSSKTPPGSRHWREGRCQGAGPGATGIRARHLADTPSGSSKVRTRWDVLRDLGRGLPQVPGTMTLRKGRGSVRSCWGRPPHPAVTLTLRRRARLGAWLSLGGPGAHSGAHLSPAQPSSCQVLTHPASQSPHHYLSPSSKVYGELKLSQ